MSGLLSMIADNMHKIPQSSNSPQSITGDSSKLNASPVIDDYVVQVNNLADHVLNTHLTDPYNVQSIANTYNFAGNLVQKVLTTGQYSAEHLKQMYNSLSNMRIWGAIPEATGFFAEARDSVDSALGMVSKELTEWNSSNPGYLVNNLINRLIMKRIINNPKSSKVASFTLPSDSKILKYSETDSTSATSPSTSKALKYDATHSPSVESSNISKILKGSAADHIGETLEAYMDRSGYYRKGVEVSESSKKIVSFDSNKNSSEFLKANDGTDRLINLTSNTSSYPMTYTGDIGLERLPDTSIWNIKRTDWDTLTKEVVAYNTILWDVTIEPYTDNVDIKSKLNHPFTSTYFPALSASVSDIAFENSFSIPLPLDRSVTLPDTKQLPRSISIDVMETQYLNVDTWMRNVMDATYKMTGQGSYSVLNYKDASFKITFYLLNPRKLVVKKLSYYALPTYDFSYNGSESNGLRQVTLDFNIIGIEGENYY